MVEQSQQPDASRVVPAEVLRYAGPTPPRVAPGPPPPVAFSQDHLAVIAEARRRYAPIRRTIGVAVFDAWSVAIFAGLTFALSFGSVPGMAVGVGMGVVAFVEFRAIARLRKLEPSAARTLALNQFFFAMVLIAYGAYHLLFPDTAMSAEVKEAISATPELESMMKDMVGTVNLLMYWGVILFALVFQCGCGVYHLSRVPLVRRYRETTPPWVMQMHENGIMR